jgi:hypothetical protein
VRRKKEAARAKEIAKEENGKPDENRLGLDQTVSLVLKHTHLVKRPAKPELENAFDATDGYEAVFDRYTFSKEYADLFKQVPFTTVEPGYRMTTYRFRHFIKISLPPVTRVVVAGRGRGRDVRVPQRHLDLKPPARFHRSSVARSVHERGHRSLQPGVKAQEKSMVATMSISAR